MAGALADVGADASALDRVGDIPLIEAAVDEIIAERVDAAREQGLSWEAIAGRLGISRQAAHKRFGQSAKIRSARRGNARIELRLERSRRGR